MIKYERIINDVDQQILENDLLDIKDWIDKAIEGKINNCMKRAAIQYREAQKSKTGALVPVSDKASAILLFKDPAYKNRVARDAAQS